MAHTSQTTGIGDHFTRALVSNACMYAGAAFASACIKPAASFVPNSQQSHSAEALTMPSPVLLFFSSTITAMALSCASSVEGNLRPWGYMYFPVMYSESCLISVSCSPMMDLTTSPMEINPTSLPFSSTGRCRMLCWVVRIMHSSVVVLGST
jgi:hypothetical protein